EQLIAAREVRTHRATIGRGLAGFILSRIAADEAEILSVAVEPATRGRGLAGDVLNLPLTSLAGPGGPPRFLEVARGKVFVRPLYRRAGFGEVGRREAYYPNPGRAPSAALVLRRDLV